MLHVFLYIFLFIISLILLLIIIPIRIKISYINYDTVGNELKEDTKFDISVYIFRYLKVYTKKNKERKQKNIVKVEEEYINNITEKVKEYIEKTKKIYNAFVHPLLISLKIKEFELYSVFNTTNVITNSYLTMLFSTCISMLIASKQDLFDLNNTSFKIESSYSRAELKLRLYSIIEINLVKTIGMLINNLIKRWKEDGTSNRKLDANSND